MSIEVQKAPNITQIVLDSSNNDLQFSLAESGVITNSTKKAVSKHIQSKDTISESISQAMATKYTDGYDTYEDDFEDEGPVRNGSRTRTKQRQQRKSFHSETHSDYTPSPPTTRRTKKNTNTRRNSLVSYRSAYGTSRASNKPSHKKAKKSQSANTRPARTDDSSMMVQKILSANRNKITKLYNVVEELQQEVDHLRDENKTLNRIHVKQERELKRVDGEAGSLPQLLQRHSAELRSYRERIKKNKVEISRKEKESHSHDVELNELRDKLHHFKKLDNDKKLEERATLAKKLDKIEKVLDGKDTKIMELQKTIKLSEKARQREIKEQQDRYKKAKDDLIKVQENVISLREKLKEKEKQLDMTNIYHQNIQRKMKKGNPLPLLPAQDEDLHIKLGSTAVHVDSTHFDKKRTNIFLTHDPSDTSSSVATELEKGQRNTERKLSTETKEKNRLSEMDESLESEKREAARLKEELEQEERRRKLEEEARRMKEEEARSREARKREQEQMREQIKRLEEQKKRNEEERKRKREEEERIRKEKEEQARLRFKEDEEIRRKKDLLLARMKAIDTHNDKPNGIIDADLNTKLQDEIPQKLPIFLQSSQKPKESTEAPSVANDNEKRTTGSSTSVRSKHSQSSSYDFKETVQNLHHGLPAHPSDQHLRGRHNSQEEDLPFGAYKPTVGRREAANKKPESFGSYNPSFGEGGKNEGQSDSGLDFGKKQDKATTQDKANDVVFGSYQPTFGGSSKPSNAAKGTENGGLDFSSKRNEGRRGRHNQPKTNFGDDLFNNNEKPKRTSIFNDDPFGSSNTTKDKNYPWEKKVNVSVNNDEDSLLPRRPKLSQGPKQTVPAIGNMLNGTLEDDIEEMTL